MEGYKMYDSNQKISKILNINEDIDVKCKMDQWYVLLLNKTIKEINIGDIYRMLRQNVLVEIAIPIAFDMLRKDPLIGEMYDGQLLEMLYRVDVNKYGGNIEEVKKILEEIHNNIDEYEWMSDEDSKSYVEILEKFLEKLS